MEGPKENSSMKATKITESKQFCNINIQHLVEVIAAQGGHKILKAKVHGLFFPNKDI